MYTAIVIANNHYNALGVIRSLGENSIPIIVVFTTLDKTFVEKSRYINTSIHIDENEISLIDAIRDICKKEEKYYIFPTTDFSSEVLDKHFCELPSSVISQHMEGHMNEAQDKLYVKSIAQQCGLFVPEGSVCDLNQIANFINKWSHFPVIIKPLMSIEGNKSDIVLANDCSSLQEELITFMNKGYYRVLVEEYIGGNDEHMIEVMGYCSVNHEPFIGGIIQKIREFPIHNGSTAYARIKDEHTGLDIVAVKNLLRAFPYTGLYDIEFKFANGKAYFIECNFRNGAPAYALTQRGINLPYLWIMSYDSINLNNFDKNYTKKEYFMCEQIDVINMFKHNVSFIKWIKQYHNSTKVFCQIKDIKPSISYYAGLIKLAIKKALCK